jgi:predicted amino acid-binding ACT domain protein
MFSTSHDGIRLINKLLDEGEVQIFDIAANAFHDRFTTIRAVKLYKSNK